MISAFGVDHGYEPVAKRDRISAALRPLKSAGKSAGKAASEHVKATTRQAREAAKQNGPPYARTRL